jgi:hypothetical protein
MLRVYIAVCFLITLASSQAGMLYPVGSSTSWPSSITWSGANTDPIGQELDGQGSQAVSDIVGNSTYPALQYGQDNNYVYFRLQIGQADITDTPNASYMIYVDRLGWQASPPAVGGTPDFAFGWDAKSKNNSTHGLEMMNYGGPSGGSTWGALTMNDVDGDNAKKGVSDINGVGGLRTGDGMIRVETGATGASGAGANSYVEFAISWNYLNTYSGTQLAPGQSWAVTAGGLYASTDHGTTAPNGDILGFGLNDTASSGGSGWAIAVPEPVNLALGFFGVMALGGTAGRRFLATRKTKNA